MSGALMGLGSIERSAGKDAAPLGSAVEQASLLAALARWWKPAP
jgi:hypothetical protein